MQRVLAVVRSRVRTDTAVLVRVSQRRCLSSLQGGGGGGKDGRKAPIFPWVLAGLTGSMTLYAAKIAESGDLFKSVVQEIHRAQGLQNLQLVMMTFGGRWTEEFRAKLAANGAVEALIPLVLRLNTEFKEAYNKLEQARNETGGLAAGLGELPLFAAAAMGMSDVTVIGNALRLRWLVRKTES